ncbi:hypothetical protein B0H16DRAFT_1585623 [Mycena metata]|uniref:Uncharacterized protein n=1 Tax=Mycena metata TaxID=1033252 RepID=A0AAD7MSK9_9AGAR|nr:hypothetical protein B0H16DRAFT_1622181 [Mycena metata]KAJ7730168.1 hypothetical protein B0H16DRAFT_1585623 [Mycena metata]
MYARFASVGVTIGILTLILVAFVRMPQASDLSAFLIRGGASPAWNIGSLDEVFMEVHNSARYPLSGPQADEQWGALFPYSGLVRLGPQRELFMVSMFHQLRCLDIIRRDYIEGSMGKNGTSAVTEHCLNFIRQMVLCRGDRRLECVVDPFGAHAVEVRGTQTCKDWTRIYDLMNSV